jgi:hypothetical protein
MDPGPAGAGPETEAEFARRSAAANAREDARLAAEGDRSVGRWRIGRRIMVVAVCENPYLYEFAYESAQNKDRDRKFRPWVADWLAEHGAVRLP